VTPREPSSPGPDPAPRGAAVPPAGPDRAARAILGLALVVGAVRFVRLGEWSLWFDEVATWTDAHHGLAGGQINNPLGYWCLAAVARLFGPAPDELGLRLLPAVAGWATVPLCWWAFRPYGARAAAGAALLVAASSWHVAWSQTARFYTLAGAVSLVGSALVLRGLARGSTGRAVLGLVVAAAAFGFHPSALLVCPALVGAAWLAAARGPLPARSRAAVLALLVSAALVAVVALPVALETWHWYGRQKGHGSPAHYALTLGFYATPVLAAGALAGAWLAWLRRDPLQLFAAALVALVLCAALAASFLVRISAQYVLCALPWIALLAALPLEGGTAAGAPLARLRAAWLFVLVVPALAATALYLTVRRGERPPWREAYELVWNERGPADLVLGMEASVGEHYVAPQETALRETRQIAWLDKWRATRPQRWAQRERRTWYVINREQLQGWEPEQAQALERHLREDCRLVRCFPLYVESRDLSVWVYVRG
jgi:hypothetical protein